MKISMRIVGVFLLSSLSACLWAQQTSFSRVIINPNINDIQIQGMTTAFDAGYMLVGDAGLSMGLIIKLDSAGNVVWNKTYGQNINVFQNVAFNAITATNDSCFVVVGQAYDTTNGQIDAYFVKIKPDGDTLWTKTLTKPNTSFAARNVQQTFDSGFIISGITTGYSNFFVAKLDVNGNMEWTYIYKGANNMVTAAAVRQTADSGYALCGYMENFPPYEPYAYLLKLSPAGDVEWAQKYNTSNFESIGGIGLETTANGFLCLIYVEGGTALMQTDSVGNIMWTKVYNNIPFYSWMENPAVPLHKTSDNGYVFETFDFASSLTKVDSIGNLLWTKRMFVQAVAATESKDQGYLVVGNGPLWGIKSQSAAWQLGVIKTDSLGNVQACVDANSSITSSVNLQTSSLVITVLPGGTTGFRPEVLSSATLLSYSGCVDIYGGIEDVHKDAEVQIFPNPSQGIFTLKRMSTATVSLFIYDRLGGLISRKMINEQQSEIDLSGQPAGMYFYKIIFTDNHFVSGKLNLVR